MRFDSLEDELQSIRQTGQYRKRLILESPQANKIIIDGRCLCNFSSNNYLGLANHAEIKQSFQKAIDQYGVGSGSAHLISGHSISHHRLEEELAEFTGRDRALLFSNGYMANLGAITALLSADQHVFEDRLNHASLLDAGLLSAGRFQRYRHNDLDDIAHKLNQRSGHDLVVTDGVFSMEGDKALLKPLSKLVNQHDSWLMVDDAHGFGVLGKHGAGLVEELNLSVDDVPVLVGTLGKSFATFGAFVAGSDILIETLIQKARTYIYTTALPSAVAEASRTSLKLVRHESWRREKLNHLIHRFRQFAQQLDLSLMNSFTPIQPILIGSNDATLKIQQALFEASFLVGAIRPPTVAKGSSRLRISLSADHELEDVERFLQCLSKIMKTV